MEAQWFRAGFRVAPNAENAEKHTLCSKNAEKCISACALAGPGWSRLDSGTRVVPQASCFHVLLSSIQNVNRIYISFYVDFYT